jgi:hypothetical protein
MDFISDCVDLVTKVLWMTLALLANLVTLSVLFIFGSLLLYLIKEVMR